MERVLLTPEEVAEALHVERCTVYDLIRTDAPSFKIGKLRRIPSMRSTSSPSGCSPKAAMSHERPQRQR